MHFAAALLIALLLLAPWVLLSLVLCRRHGLIERVALGISCGFAATVTGAYLFALAGFLPGYLILFLLAAAGSLLLAWRSRGKAVSLLNEPIPRAILPWFWAGLGIIVLCEAIPTFSSTVPLGWDPPFHCLLAQRILDTHSLPRDWRPFAPIALHYPQGIHAYLALVALCSGQPVHLCFQVHHLLFQCLAAVLVFLLAWRILREARASLLAMMAYGLLGDWGTFFSYFGWGGLPTELAAVLFLAMIWLYLSDGSRWTLLPGTLLFGSIILVHHLSSLISVWILLFYCLILLLGRSWDELGRRFLATLGLAAVAYSFFIIPYVAGIGEIGGTDALKFR